MLKVFKLTNTDKKVNSFIVTDLISDPKRLRFHTEGAKSAATRGRIARSTKVKPVAWES